jgi:hypothetical protein
MLHLHPICTQILLCHAFVSATAATTRAHCFRQHIIPASLFCPVCCTGTYTFFVAPTVQISTDSTYDLPSNYGNVGDYSLTVEFPGGAQPPDCNTLTTCNPRNICTSGCSCSSPATGAPICSCNAALGLKRGNLAGKSACVWNLLQPSFAEVPKWSIPGNIGYFSAPVRSLVKLPWTSTGCPAAGKALITSAVLKGVRPCPNTTFPTPLELAGSSELVNTEKCTVNPVVPTRRQLYRVMRVVLAGGAVPTAGSCYGLRVATSDGRAYNGVMQVTTRRARSAALP